MVYQLKATEKMMAMHFETCRTPDLECHPAPNQHVTKDKLIIGVDEGGSSKFTRVSGTSFNNPLLNCIILQHTSTTGGNHEPQPRRCEAICLACAWLMGLHPLRSDYEIMIIVIQYI